MIAIRTPFLMAVACAFFGQSMAFAQTQTLSEKIEAIRRNYSLPGMVAGHYQNGELVEATAVGVRKTKNETAMTINDKLHIGSLTKSMTATMIGMYVEDGKLKWTSTLSDLFPEIEVHPKLKTVTLEMLLTHMSGLSRGLGMYQKELDEAYKEVDESKLSATDERALVFGVVLKAAPQNDPDKSFQYSNTGYVLIGHILERIMQKSWEELIQEKLFRPLDMSSCGFGFPGDPKLSIPDQPWGHGLDLVNNLIPDSTDNFVFWGPAGRVHCSLKDVNKYYTMHLNGFNGIDGLVKAKTFTKLHTVYPGQEYTYGAFFRVERAWAGGPAFTHSGSNEKNMAYVWLAPKKNITFFGYTNVGGDKAAKAINEAITTMINPIR